MKQLLLFICLSAAYSGTFAQTAEGALAATILHQDSLFWTAYNRCDVVGMATFFTEDVEFYHDKGGPTLGLPEFTRSLQNNLCGNPDFRLRREAVPGTVQVFPLQKGDAVYGAVLTGEHVFYILEKGQAPKLDGHARFTHLWLLRDGAWKMTRILSYDHGPAELKKE